MTEQHLQERLVDAVVIHGGYVGGLASLVAELIDRDVILAQSLAGHFEHMNRERSAA